MLADHRLLQMTQRLAREWGKLSLRALSSLVGISRTTLSGRLKGLVQRGVTTMEELTKLVGIEKQASSSS